MNYQMLKKEKRKLRDNFGPKNVILKGYDYNLQSENKEEFTHKEESKEKESSDKEESADKEESLDLSDIPPLEGDEEEIREGKGIKNLTSNKILTKLPTLLVEIKAGNNSHKLKNETRQILYNFCISIIKSREKFTTSQHNNGRKSDCDKRSQISLF